MAKRNPRLGLGLPLAPRLLPLLDPLSFGLFKAHLRRAALRSFAGRLCADPILLIKGVVVPLALLALALVDPTALLIKTHR